ncbi:uncharacterized protein A4U43_C08F12580 [Asparagus officinalis]|nr:uncharacterized protein A4U43_C08F12580 [Asparagus officinalis]
MHMASQEELQYNVEARPTGKRSRRPTEEEHLALCLIMLARSRLTKSTSDPPPAQNLPYKCLVCGRGFACYQALGGHTSSHKKIPGSSEDRGALADKNVDPDCDRKRGGVGAPAMASSACKGLDLNLPTIEAEEEEEVVSHLAVK